MSVNMGELFRKEVAGLPFFVPNLSTNKEVCDFMTPYIRTDGAFILRQGIRDREGVSISIIHNHSIVHINIRHKDDRFYISRRQFKSVIDLVNHFCIHDVPNDAGIFGLRLAIPIEQDYVKFVLQPGRYVNTPRVDSLLRERAKCNHCGGTIRFTGSIQPGESATQVVAANTPPDVCTGTPDPLTPDNPRDCYRNVRMRPRLPLPGEVAGELQRSLSLDSSASPGPYPYSYVERYDETEGVFQRVNGGVGGDRHSSGPYRTDMPARRTDNRTYSN